MSHKSFVVILSLVLALMGLGLIVAPVTFASPNSGVVGTGTPGSCTDAALATALNGGGLVTFNCGGPATLTIVSDKNINSTTTLDGGGNITLTANSGIRLAYINAGRALTLTNLTVANINESSISYIPIYNDGALVVSNVQFLNNRASPIYNYCSGCAYHLTIINSQFISNTGTNMVGTSGAGYVTITHSSFISTSAEAVYLAGAVARLDEVQFIGGYSNYDAVRTDNRLSISNSLFQSNTNGFGSSPIWVTGGGAVLTLTSSSFVSNTNTSNYPSAIYNNFGTLYISNTTFLSNTAVNSGDTIYENNPLYAQIVSSTFQSNAGGAIYINSGGNPLVIADSQFISNTATCTTAGISAGTLTVTHSSFIGNVVSGGACNPYSGAIDSSGNAYISDSTFLNNRGTRTGALYLTSGSSTVYRDNVIRTVIKGNVGPGQWGSGLSSTEILTVTDSDISDNILRNSNSGAGLYYTGPALTLSRTLIYNNVVTGTSGMGGGLYATGVSTLINNTIYSNSASNGGGVYIGGGTLHLINNTIVSNTATITTNASNLRNAGTVYLRNNVIAGGPVNCSGTPVSVGHNLSSDASCKLTGTLDLTNTQPLLAAFANNGGPTFSFMPQASSPLVNAGDNNQCPADDQRGVGRPIGPACDIGAIESPYLTPQTIAFAALADRVVTDPPFAITATASSNLVVALNASGVCAVNGITVTLSGLAGSCTITATQPGDSNFAPATPVARSFNVAQLTQTITFDALPNHPISDAPFIVTAIASSGLPVTFTSQTNTTCTVAGSLVTLVAGGVCTVRAEQGGSYTYAPAPNVDRSFTVLLTQTISFAALPTHTLGDAPFSIAPTASSGLSVTLASQTSNVCAVNGNLVSVLNGGTCTIRASQSGDATYAPAPNVDQSFTVLLTQTIAFAALPDRLITAPPFALTATASSNLPVAFNASGVCAVNGITVTLGGVIGTCTITATQPGNASYAPASPVAHTFTVAPQLAQTIAFGALANKVMGDAAFPISATASSGLSVTFASQTNSVCSISNSTVTLLSGGTCIVRASQSGDATYAPAPAVDQPFTVFFTQTIDFALVADHRITDAAFAVAPTASSGLSVTVSSLTLNVCTVDNNFVALIGGGTCTLRASQGGDTVYAAAPNVERSFMVKLLTLYLPLVQR